MRAEFGRYRWWLATAALLPAVLLPACGGNSDEPPAYHPGVADQLRADTADVRAAAERRKARAAQAALHRLTRHVAAAQANGQLPPHKARQILAAADLVAEDLAAMAARAPRRPPERDKDDHGERRHPGKGHGADDDEPEDWESYDGKGEKPEGWEAHKKES